MKLRKNQNKLISKKININQKCNSKIKLPGISKIAKDTQAKYFQTYQSF